MFLTKRPKEYLVEGNIDFFKAIKEEEEIEIKQEKQKEQEKEETLECHITGTPLNANSVTLACGHSFNYDALFHDAYEQKYVSNANETKRVNIKYIRCPYCRTIHQGLLPILDDFPKLYGVNYYTDTLDYFKMSQICSPIPYCLHIHSDGQQCSNTVGTMIEGEYFCHGHLGKQQRKIKFQQETEYKTYLLAKQMQIKQTQIQQQQQEKHKLQTYCQTILSRGPRKGEHCQKRVKVNSNCCSSHINKNI